MLQRFQEVNFINGKRIAAIFALALLCVSLTGCFKSETRLFQEGKYVADITEPFFINDEVEFTKKIKDMYVELHEIDSKTYEASQHKNVVKNRVNKKVFEIGVYVKFEGEDNFTRIELTEQRRRNDAPNTYHFDMLYVDDGKNYIISAQMEFSIDSPKDQKSRNADKICLITNDVSLYGKQITTHVGGWYGDFLLEKNQRG